MRSLLDPFRVFSPRAAAENARRELVRAETGRAQTTALARRIATIDAVAGRATIVGTPVPDAA